jgi:hypothetical protein
MAAYLERAQLAHTWRQARGIMAERARTHRQAELAGAKVVRQG